MQSTKTKYVSFVQARAFVHTLNLRSKYEWYAYHKENSIKDIPNAGTNSSIKPINLKQLNVF